MNCASLSITITPISASAVNVRFCDFTRGTTARDPLSAHKRLNVFVGRRGKPVRKLRYIQMARAYELAPKRKGSFGATVSVV